MPCLVFDVPRKVSGEWRCQTDRKGEGFSSTGSGCRPAVMHRHTTHTTTRDLTGVSRPDTGLMCGYNTHLKERRSKTGSGMSIYLTASCKGSYGSPGSSCCRPEGGNGKRNTAPSINQKLSKLSQFGSPSHFPIKLDPILFPFWPSITYKSVNGVQFVTIFSLEEQIETSTVGHLTQD